MNMRVREKILVIAFAVFLLGLAVKLNNAELSSSIVDVSWPNCSYQAKGSYAYGIVGVTGGINFHRNPCLGEEASWFEQHADYINTGYPGNSYGDKYKSYPQKCKPNATSCLAYNYGYNAALFAIKYAAQQNAFSNRWWLDVETDNSWTTDYYVNIQSLQGAENAIKAKVFMPSVGFYSDNWQWLQITGSWQNKIPEWYATGGVSKSLAKASCNEKSFNGGPIIYSQYTLMLDEDYKCT
jgi:hypothetical protein